MDTTTRYASFIGRLLIGLPFAMSGFGKLAAYGATSAYIAAAGYRCRRWLMRSPFSSNSAAACC